MAQNSSVGSWPLILAPEREGVGSPGSSGMGGDQIGESVMSIFHPQEMSGPGERLAGGEAVESGHFLVHAFRLANRLGMEP